MTKDDIIRMAIEACEEGQDPFVSGWITMDHAELERFAQLVCFEHWSKQTTVSDIRDAVAAEREACARAAGIALLGADRALTERVLKAIRARGEQ
jgi:hypothetical protein